MPTGKGREAIGVCQEASGTNWLARAALALERIAAVLESNGVEPADVDAEAVAMAMLARNPAMKKVEIADALKVHRSTLDRWPTFQKAWRMRQGASRVRSPRYRGFNDGNGLVDGVDAGVADT